MSVPNYVEYTYFPNVNCGSQDTFFSLDLTILMKSMID